VQLEKSVISGIHLPNLYRLAVSFPQQLKVIAFEQVFKNIIFQVRCSEKSHKMEQGTVETQISFNLRREVKNISTLLNYFGRSSLLQRNHGLYISF
jgi:hypothetical protein